MATQVQNRRGTTAEHSTFTGAVGEVTIDTDKDTVVVHDGSTAGGHPLMRETGSQDLTTSGNIAVTNQGEIRLGEATANGFNYVALQAPAALAADVTYTLPDADGTSGQVLSTNGSGTLSWATAAAGATDKIEEGNTSAEVIDTGSDGRFVVTTEGVEALRVDSSQRVGIGTTSPGAALNIGADGDFWLASSVNTVEEKNLISWRIEDGSEGARISAFREAVSNAPHSILFGTRTSGGTVTEKARIDSSGRLLVGTSSSSSTAAGFTPAIQAVGTNATASAAVSITRYGNDSNEGILSIAKSRGTLGVQTVVTNGDSVGRIDFEGSNGSAFLRAASIQAAIDGAVSGGGVGDMPGRLVFSTTADGASSPTERMRILNSGNIILGGGVSGANASLSIYPDASNGAALADWNRADTASTSTAARFRNNAVTVGSISYTNTATAYNTSSDYRLKENVVPLTGAIDRVNQLQVKRFNFIADPDTTVDGFIAHEAQAVVPECVTGTKDEVDDEGNPVYQGIDQSKLVPLLTAALQEAIGEIESLKARVAALEA